MHTIATDFSLIFQFTFNPYVILSLFSFFVNLGIAALVAYRGSRSAANGWFILFLLCLALWALSEALTRISANTTAVSFWDALGGPGWIFMSPMFFFFTLSYTGKGEIYEYWWFKALTMGPAFLVLFLTWTTNLINDHTPSLFLREPWGWNNQAAPYFWVAIVWLEAFFVAGLILLTLFALKTKDPLRKKGLILMVAGGLLPMFVGTITDAIFPIVGIKTPGTAILLTSVFGTVVAYAILRYKLFVLSPTTAVSTITDTMSEALVMFGPANTVEFVNPTTLHLLEYRKEELIGQEARKLFSNEEQWNGFNEGVLTPLKGGKSIQRFETEFVTSGGKRIPINFSGSALLGEKGEVNGIVGVATDISETKKFITDLEAERNKLSTVMSSIADGVLALDNEGNVILANPAALEILGIDQGAILGKRIWSVLTMYDGDERLTYKDLVPEKAVTKDTIVAQKKNLKVLTSFGKQVFIDLTSSSIKEGSEIGLGVIITMNDVSKEKELEEMKIDFVSMAAHELRTPLTAIRGYLSVLQEEVSEDLPHEQRSFLDKAFISSSQLAALVENLLSVAKIERGAMKLGVEPTDWRQALKEAVSNFLPLAKERGVNITLVEPAKLPKVLVDKFRISEVLSNLLANGIAYTKPGGKIEVSTEASEEEVTTHVKDTGQGIPESAIPRLFTKFFRVSGVLEQGSKGTGLGLYIAKAIVDMNKGKIWVESKLGVGSTFSFTVPIVQEVSQTDSKEKEIGLAALSTVNSSLGSKKPTKPRLFKRKLV